MTDVFFSSLVPTPCLQLHTTSNQKLEVWGGLYSIVLPTGSAFLKQEGIGSGRDFISSFFIFFCGAVGDGTLISPT